jgi:hypothetical protein
MSAKTLSTTSLALSLNNLSTNELIRAFFENAKNGEPTPPLLSQQLDVSQSVYYCLNVLFYFFINIKIISNHFLYF